MRRPNILWICTDSQRFDTVSALGHAAIRTPNLDRLCRSGAAFTRCYSQSPICTPSRASFLTGLYPGSLGVPRNGNAVFPEAAPLITRQLADVGYECGLVGKLHLASAYQGREARVADGYGYFCYSHAPFQGEDAGNQYIEWLKAQNIGMDRIFHRNAQGQLSGYRPDLAPELSQAHWCADRAIEFLRSRERPWLLSINFFDPHPAFSPAPAFRSRYEPRTLRRPAFGPRDLLVQDKLREWPVFCPPAHVPGEAEQASIADYFATIELLDFEIGRLLTVLEETGQLERTLVLMHSDHGELLGDHGLSHKGCRFYEGSVRVPMIWSWPELIHAGVQVDVPVGLVDIVPTLCGLLELPQSPSHGDSLAGALTGGELGPRRLPLRCEYHDACNFNAPGPSRQAAWATMMIEDQYKIVVYHGHEHEHEYGELYDLAGDPQELSNLWHEERYEALCHRLLRRCCDATIAAGYAGAPLLGRY